MNPFLSLLSDNFLDKYDLAIQAIIERFARQAKFVFPTTKYEECSSCTQSISAGPNPFLGGQKGKYNTSCSICGGTNKIPVESFELLSIPVIFNYKQFEDLNTGIIFTPRGDAITISNKGTIKTIKTCTHVIFDRPNEYLNTSQFVRDGEPIIEGFRKNFLITSWKVIS